MVGAVGEKEGNLLTNYARLPRQVGSSMKPLTAYAPALDEGTITPATVFDNYPVQLLNGNPWPKNSPNTYSGRTILSTGHRQVHQYHCHPGAAERRAWQMRLPLPRKS